MRPKPPVIDNLGVMATSVPKDRFMDQESSPESDRESGPDRPVGDVAKDAVSGGFSAQFHSASLWDLVQMECLARTRGAVRVTSKGQSGLLFFDGGRIVHAETAQAVGETAALEILGWESGSFDPCHVGWPRSTSITMGSEGLLLRAAQGRDEGGGSNLVAFPGRTVEASAPDASDPEAFMIIDDKDWESEVTRPAGPNMGLETNRYAPSRGSDQVDLPLAVRVAPNGTVLEASDDDLGDAIAYAGRLAALIGDLIGLDGFRALECASKDERIVMFMEEGGDLVAGRISALTDITALRERLGL